MNHHKEGPDCPLCEEKLSTAHEILRDWYSDLKREFPDVHISCAWRGPEEQRQAFDKGLSRANYPHSRHNHQKDDQPCSLALDLFQLEEGQAKFKPRYFGEIHRFNTRNGHPIQWGGKFRSLKDCVHFELIHLELNSKTGEIYNA